MTIKWALALLFITLPSFATESVIRFYENPKINPQQLAYYTELLTTVIDETRIDYPQTRLQPVTISMSQSRLVMSLQAGKIFDVTWLMTSKDREQNLLPIRIPLLKGLMGYRLLLINKGHQDKFANISTLAQLKKRVGGQSFDWPDTEILLSNGLVLVAGPAATLHQMLMANRFDYFPRGISEIWREEKLFDTLVIEQNLVLHYPAVEYFFVQAGNTELAQRIEVGLTRAKSNGRFEAIFQSHGLFKSSIKKANLAQRTVIELKNTALSLPTQQILANSNLLL
ncbi:MAG: hypothetical protein ACJA13_000375 [Paraglaciecola sp.]|jgi:hypothetical protein